jgi:G3E family GTPase
VSTLELLIETKPEIEHIFVETNGLADPANIIKIFWLDDDLMSNIELNYTMGVIDAKNFMKNINDSETSLALERQLIHADKILINKVDLVDSKGIESIEAEIKSFNPIVEIRHTEYANADLDYLIAKPERLNNFKER